MWKYKSVNYYSFRSREVAEVEAEGGAKATVLEDNLLLMVSTKHLYFLSLFITNFHYNIKVPSLLSHGMMSAGVPE